MEKFSFGWALCELELGNRVCRSGWNGKGMWLAMCGSIRNMPRGFIAARKEYHDIEPFIVMKTADRKYVAWTASQTDLLAQDWQLVSKDYATHTLTTAELKELHAVKQETAQEPVSHGVDAVRYGMQGGFSNMAEDEPNQFGLSDDEAFRLRCVELAVESGAKDTWEINERSKAIGEFIKPPTKRKSDYPQPISIYYVADAFVTLRYEHPAIAASIAQDWAMDRGIPLNPTERAPASFQGGACPDPRPKTER